MSKKRQHDNGLFGTTTTPSDNSNKKKSLVSCIFGNNDMDANGLFSDSNKKLLKRRARQNDDWMQKRHQYDKDDDKDEKPQKPASILQDSVESITVNVHDYYIIQNESDDGCSDDDQDEMRLLLGRCDSVMQSQGVLILTWSSKESQDNKQQPLLLDSALLQKMSKRAEEIELEIDHALDKAGQGLKQGHDVSHDNSRQEQQQDDNHNEKEEACSFRYTEVASRCRGRLDIRWCMDQPPFTLLKENYILHNVMTRLLGDDYRLIYTGLILSKPGSVHQPWHQDGKPLFDELHMDLPPHAMNVFVPLTNITSDLGPTEFVLESHLVGKTKLILEGLLQDANSDATTIVAPLVKLGDMLIYDYRTCHRGTANTSPDTVRPMVYMIYAKPWFQEHLNFGTTSLFGRIKQSQK